VSVVANVAINVDSRGAVSKLREVQAQSKQTERAFGGIAAAATKLAVAFGGIQAARFVFAKTAELESQSRSLAILAGSAEKAGQIIKELQDLGAVTPFTSTELIDSAKRLQAFGVEADKVVETTRRLADASGATGAELSGLVTAYGQVQAKGRLQGEELLQFQERGIALQEELRKMYGMTGEEFQKALSKGQVSAKAVEVALQNLTNTGGKYANGAIAQSDTLNGRLSTLQDGVDALARRIGQVLTPALKAIFNQAIAVVDAINAALAAGRGGGFTRNVAGAKQFLNIGATSQAVDNIAKGVGQVSSQKNKSGIQQNLQALQQYQRLLQSIGADDPNAGRAVQLQGEILTKINQNLAAQKQLQSGAKQVDKLFTPPLLGAAPAGGGGGNGGADKAANDAARAAEQAAQAEQQIQERLRGLTREIELNAQISTIKELQFQAEMDGNKELQARLQGEERIIQIIQSTAQSLDGITDERLQQKILAKAEGEIASANQETALEMQRIEAERTKSFDAIIADLTLELKLKTATTEQEREQLRIAAERAKLEAQLKGLPQPQIDQAIALQAQVAAPLTDVQKIDQHIGKLKTEIADLTSTSNIAITAAEGIGNAFATSFKGLVDGTMTAKEALGSFFKSVADMFLEMAAQIIAKQITMIILQTILKALGGAPGGGFGGDSDPLGAGGGFWNTGDVGRTPVGFANGGAFTNSIVSSPTMFKFADGGAMKTGVFGEAGPEAIMPLSRGADGSLGVQANGLREAMDRQQGGASGSPVLNMSFQSTSINGVEYVSRDQLESAMAETRRASTRDGAKRGMTMTLDRIQNSSSTRRKVGI
jgi:lambda family phage tail tape measure protein